MGSSYNVWIEKGITKFINYIYDNSVYKDKPVDYFQDENIDYCVIINKHLSSFRALLNNYNMWCLTRADYAVLQDKLTTNFLDTSIIPVLKYKVGDIVTCVKNDYERFANHSKGLYYTEDKVFKIHRISDNMVFYKDEGGTERQVAKIAIRKATELEIQKFTTTKILPCVNGYKGHLSDNKKEIHYGCARLSVEWFKRSTNRNLKEIHLSSGVCIYESTMNDIRDFLTANNII